MLLTLLTILSVTLLASLIITSIFFIQRKTMMSNRKRLDKRYETLSEKYTLLRKRVEDFFHEEGTGKVGLIQFDSNYVNSVRGYVEIEEIKRAGDMVKIRILDVSPMKGTTEEQLIKKMNEWVDDSKITWVDGWQQKVRSKSLDDILDDETKIDPDDIDINKNKEE